MFRASYVRTVERELLECERRRNLGIKGLRLLLPPYQCASKAKQVSRYPHYPSIVVEAFLFVISPGRGMLALSPSQKKRLETEAKKS